MLATVDDVEAYTQRTIIGSDVEAAVTRLLELASDVVRDHTGQTLSFVEGDTVTLRGDGSGRWVLPERPVTAVSAVETWSGSVIAEFDWTRWGSVGPAITAYPVSSNASWWDTPTLTVTYDHGYETIPGAIISVVCGMVGRQLDNPRGIRSWSIGTASEVYTIPASGDVQGLSLNRNEQQILNRYKRAGSSILVVR